MSVPSEILPGSFVSRIFFLIKERYTVEWEDAHSKKKSPQHRHMYGKSKKARLKPENVRLWGGLPPTALGADSTNLSDSTNRTTDSTKKKKSRKERKQAAQQRQAAKEQQRKKRHEQMERQVEEQLQKEESEQAAKFVEEKKLDDDQTVPITTADDSGDEMDTTDTSASKAANGPTIFGDLPNRVKKPKNISEIDNDVQDQFSRLLKEMGGIPFSSFL